MSMEGTYQEQQETVAYREVIFSDWSSKGTNEMAVRTKDEEDGSEEERSDEDRDEN